MDKEEAYRRHLQGEHWSEMYAGEWEDDPSNPDGCFFCGSFSHPSDCCPDEQAQADWWEDAANGPPCYFCDEWHKDYECDDEEKIAEYYESGLDREEEVGGHQAAMEED